MIQVSQMESEADPMTNLDMTLVSGENGVKVILRVEGKTIEINDDDNKIAGPFMSVLLLSSLISPMMGGVTALLTIIVI